MRTPASRMIHLAVVICATLGPVADSVKTTFGDEDQGGKSTAAEIEIKITGHLLVAQNRVAPAKHALDVSASLGFEDTQTNSDENAVTHCRVYSLAKAEMKVGENRFERRLDEARKNVLVQNSGAKLRFRPQQGVFTFEENELVQTPFDPCFILRMLQAKRDGEVWKLDDRLLASVLLWDKVTTNQLEFKESNGKIEAAGSAEGISNGAKTKAEIKFAATLGSESQTLTAIAVAIKENREVSVREPGLETILKLTGRFEEKLQSEELALMVASTRDSTDDSASELSTYTSTNGRFTLQLDSNWRPYADKPDVAAFRYVAGSELVAQMNISRLTDTPNGRVVSLEGYADDVKKTLKGKLQQLVESRESVQESGMRMLRVTALGRSGETPIMWIFCHLSDDSGRRVSLAFTLEEKYAEQFAGAEERMISSIRFTDEPSNDGVVKSVLVKPSNKNPVR